MASTGRPRQFTPPWRSKVLYRASSERGSAGWQGPTAPRSTSKTLWKRAPPSFTTPSRERAAQPPARHWPRACAFEFIKVRLRPCKPILAIGDAWLLIEKAGIPGQLTRGKPDRGLIRSDSGGERDLQRFVEVVAQHRAFERETDPPIV